MTDSDEALRIYRDISEYCDTYNIPRDNLLDILEDQKVLPMTRGTSNIDALRRATYDDWRACLPSTIAQADGTLPRTPKVRMTDDPNWFRLERLTENLRTLINGSTP